jgi:hypothetical protein
MLNTFFNNPDKKDSSLNVFFKGAGIEGFTLGQLNSRARGRKLLNTSRPTPDTYETYADYVPGTAWGFGEIFKDLQNIEYIIYDTRVPVSMNAIDGFEARSTVINYIWIPLVNNLGRQAFQESKWLKMAYFPLLTYAGKRTFFGVESNNNLKIYFPNVESFGNDTFTFNAMTIANQFLNTKLYLKRSVWEDVVINETNAAINSFVRSNGTVILIDNFVKPLKPVNVSITNITNNSFNLSFDASYSQNTISDYEVFCVTPLDRKSGFFYHSQIKTNSELIEGLEANTQYEVKIRTTDIYYNLSEFTEIIIITTTL